MRYFIGFLITLGLIIVLIFMLFSGGNGGGGEKKTEVTPKTLDSYASTSAVTSLTIDGVTNANETHRQIRIAVDRDTVTYQVIKGYEGDVIQQQIFANSQSAYQNFLAALNRAGFTLGDTSKELSSEQGYCPLGMRYIFAMTQDGAQLQRFWATSCGGAKSYLGNVRITTELFQAQVPDYDDLSNDVDLQ